MKTIPLSKLTTAIVKILDDLRMTDIVVCDTRQSSVMFDKIIIATCNTARQAHAAIRDMHKAKLPLQNIEGQKAEEWLLADCGAVVVHMMLPKIRDYFRLEELWKREDDVEMLDDEAPSKPLRKRAAAKKVEVEDAPAAKKVAVKKSTTTSAEKTKNTTTKKAAVKPKKVLKTSKAEVNTATEVVAPRKTPAVKKAAAKKTPVKD